MGSLDIKYLLEVAMAYLPSGFRFHPTDEEVIIDYLHMKVCGSTQEFIVMPEIDICQCEPDELLVKFQEKSIVHSKDHEGWFFCKQEQGQTAQRSTKEGYWKVTGKPSDVKASSNQQVIGKKRFVTFYTRAHERDSKDRKTNWVMHEYYLPDCSLTGNNFVVCHIMLKQDNAAVSSPLFSVECARNDLTDIVDDSLPEGLIQARMRSLLPLLEIPSQRTYHANDTWSAAMGSATTEESQSFGQQSFNDTGDSSLMIQFDDNYMDEDQYLAVHGTDQFGQIVELSSAHGPQPVIMENRQTQKVKSIHGVLPVDEKEGFVEDTSIITKPLSKPEGRGETSLETLNTKPPLVKGSVKSENIYRNSEGSGPLGKVKMESASSGIAPVKAKINLQAMEAKRLATAASLIQKKQLTTSSLEILREGKKLGQETKLKSETKSVSFCSTCSCKECSCNPPPIVYLVNLFVGIIVLIVVLSAMFNL